MEDEGGPGLYFSLCIVCGSRPWGAAAFHLCLFILLLKLLNVRRFPPPPSRVYQLRYIGLTDSVSLLPPGSRHQCNEVTLSSSTVVTPHLTLPKLLRGTRDRWVAQVSFITIYSTSLAPFPRLSAPPHSPQIVHPKMTILSSFTHPQVVPNLYEFLCFVEHILKKVCYQAVLGHNWLP